MTIGVGTGEWVLGGKKETHIDPPPKEGSFFIGLRGGGHKCKGRGEGKNKSRVGRDRACGPDRFTSCGRMIDEGRGGALRK